MKLVRLLMLAWLMLFAHSLGAQNIPTKTLIVGSELDYPPFAVGATDDTADGFTVKLWQIVAHEAGLKYVVRVEPFHQLLQDFQDGKIDVLINLAQSDERRQFADFTVPHVTVHAAIFIRKGTRGINSERDLLGKSVIVVKADIAHEYALTQNWGNKLVLVPTAAEGLRLLASGRHDAMFISKLVGMQTLDQLKLPVITALPVMAGATQKFSFAVHKGDANLLAALNEGLALAKSSGAYDKLYNQWFSLYEIGEPSLRNMLNYVLPLSAIFLGYVFISFLRGRRANREAQRQLAESHYMLQTVIDTMPLRVFWKDRDSRYLGCNAFFAEDAGVATPDGVIGKLDTDFPWRDNAALYRDDDQLVITSGKPKLAFDEPITVADGRQKWLRTSKVPLRNIEQEVIGMIGVFYDITAAKKTEMALIESENRLFEILENVSAFIYLKDSEGKYLFANKMVRDLWNVSLEQIMGSADDKFFDAESAARIRQEDRRVLDHGESIRLQETNTVARTGLTATYWSVKIPLRKKDGEIYALCGISTDISEVMRAQEEMQLATMVYQATSEAMMVTDAEGNVITINPAFTKTTGYTLEEIQGHNPRFLNSQHHDLEFYQAMWSDIRTTGAWQGEIWDKRKNGEIYPKWMTVNTTYKDDGTPYRRIALFSDITEKKKSEQIIWRQANFDALTGLPNRRMFHDRLEQELKKAHRHERKLAVLFIDLDRFKEINDSLGHDSGDILLIEAARRLSQCVRESDTVARLGGDEFTIILGDLENTQGVDRIVKCLLKAMSEPFTLNVDRAYVSASVGITLYPDDALGIETLIKNADQAMYAAKHQGRNRACYFTPSMENCAKLRMGLSNDLRVALEEKQFWIAYQPIVEMASGAIHKAEALIRWEHPVRGLVSPGEFIPVAEETGLIVDIGNWVFQEAAATICHWRRNYDPAFQISVNKSPLQFLNDGANAKSWLDLMEEIEVPHQSIVIEITEGIFLESDPAVDNMLFKFRNRGVHVAIDDFGTGYSSLSYLKKFDIDYLKIDQSFVRNLPHSARDLALCEAIIVMGHKLGMKIIAEGVETREQRDLLLAAKCDYAQGYFFSRPIPAADFEKFLWPK
jgi:diguanylate cyclase (GGDEF)-like protein/PAS domain S-box-containing protein